MNDFLRKFDTIRSIAPWSIFRNFSFFWIQIWILNLGRFDTGPNRNRPGPVWPVTGQIGPVPNGFVNPGCGIRAENSNNAASCSTGQLERDQEEELRWPPGAQPRRLASLVDRSTYRARSRWSVVSSIQGKNIQKRDMLLPRRRRWEL